MIVKSLHTKIFKLNENINDFLTTNIKTLKENDIVCVTSKIISLAENQIVSKTKTDKKDLIKSEADEYLADGPYDVALTIKHGIMIPSAGIDESNAEGDYYILYPKDPFNTAKNICEHLKKHYKLKNLGVVLTDSHTQPLRRGVVGVALSHWGFKGVKNYIGKKDLFGRELKYTTVHCADAIAVSAVFAMGESNEAKPIAIVSNVDVEFTNSIDPKEGLIEPENDLYYSLYKKN